MIPGAHLLAWLVVDFVELASQRTVCDASFVVGMVRGPGVLIAPKSFGSIVVAARCGWLGVSASVQVKDVPDGVTYEPPFLTGAAA